MLEIPRLHNRYYVMRHGHSQANEKGIIVSDPKNGLSDYGLTDKGKHEAKVSISEAALRYSFDVNLLIISSDFLRCRETAELVSGLLGTSNVELEPRLRERFFGELELGPNSEYKHIWERDALNETVGAFGAESAQETLERCLAVIGELEAGFQEETFLLVSHGDPLQILSTAFHNLPPGRHQELSLLETGEIRALI
ncbi:histidine phosphatase family protein [Patescibacteria group bacterium]|nr:histidine phosphatase family protein [Patescibacteria group bacterium]